MAVDDDLTNVRDALLRRGYDVVTLDQPGWAEANAVVIKGMDRDFMDVQDVTTRAPVIDASGLTEEEIVQAIEDRLTLQEPRGRF
ncbi:MAG: YkuS family protein [Firmicutes bacterium]|nr:YkuS family protein [Bacillota bacterium]